MGTVWHHLWVPGIPIIEKILRTIAVYAFVLVGLRVLGKRELGQLNPVDFIVLLLLSNAVQNAIIGDDTSLSGGLLGGTILFMLDAGLVWITYRSPWLRRLIEGRPEEIIRDGKVLRSALRRNSITWEDLESAARKEGITHFEELACAYLELNGTITFTRREPSEHNRFQEEVMARLDAIDRRLAAHTSGAGA